MKYKRKSRHTHANRTEDRPDLKAAAIVFIGKDKFQPTEVLSRC
jgi:hypothetical protein